MQRTKNQRTASDLCQRYCTHCQSIDEGNVSTGNETNRTHTHITASIPFPALFGSQQMKVTTSRSSFSYKYLSKWNVCLFAWHYHSHWISVCISTEIDFCLMFRQYLYHFGFIRHKRMVSMKLNKPLSILVVLLLLLSS